VRHFVESLLSAIVISYRVIIIVPISVIGIHCCPTFQKAIVLPTPPFPIVPPLLHNRASRTIVPSNPPDEYINICFLPSALPFLPLPSFERLHGHFSYHHSLQTSFTRPKMDTTTLGASPAPPSSPSPTTSYSFPGLKKIWEKKLRDESAKKAAGSAATSAYEPVIDTQFEYSGDSRLPEKFRREPGIPRMVELGVILRYQKKYLHHALNDANFSVELLLDLVHQALNPQPGDDR
jgi:hypothetical protein